jgi:hypothetical protein
MANPSKHRVIVYNLNFKDYCEGMHYDHISAVECEDLTTLFDEMYVENYFLVSTTLAPAGLLYLFFRREGEELAF